MTPFIPSISLASRGALASCAVAALVVVTAAGATAPCPPDSSSDPVPVVRTTSSTASPSAVWPAATRSVDHRSDGGAAVDRDRDPRRTTGRAPGARRPQALGRPRTTASSPAVAPAAWTAIVASRRPIDRRPVRLDLAGVPVERLLPFVAESTGKTLEVRMVPVAPNRVTLMGSEPVSRDDALARLYEAFATAGIAVLEDERTVVLDGVASVRGVARPGAVVGPEECLECIPTGGLWVTAVLPVTEMHDGVALAAVRSVVSDRVSATTVPGGVLLSGPSGELQRASGALRAIEGRPLPASIGLAAPRRAVAAGPTLVLDGTTHAVPGARATAQTTTPSTPVPPAPPAPPVPPAPPALPGAPTAPAMPAAQSLSAPAGATDTISIPAPLDAAAIDTMSRREAQEALSRLARARQVPGLPPETSARFKREFNALIERLRATSRRPSSSGTGR